MVTCPNCNQLVEEGKFCEKCGGSLAGAVSNASNVVASANVCPKCGAQVSGGKFCDKCGSMLTGGGNQNSGNAQQSVSNLFNKLGNSINTLASDALAVKSDFSNNTILYMSNRVPQGQDKKIKVDDTEVVFFNSGNGFTKYSQSFFTQSNSFVCFYIRNTTIIPNNFRVDFDALIKNLNEEDKIHIAVNYNLELTIEDVELFFKTLVGMRQDSWKVVDVNTMLSDNLSSIVSENTINMLKEDGNLDLRDATGQIGKFTNNISNLINEAVKQYGLKVNNFILKNTETIVNEINSVLIKNLYKE